MLPTCSVIGVGAYADKTSALTPTKMLRYRKTIPVTRSQQPQPARGVKFCGLLDDPQESLVACVKGLCRVHFNVARWVNSDPAPTSHKKGIDTNKEAVYSDRITRRRSSRAKKPGVLFGWNSLSRENQ